ncbi:hypothetical protein B7463_g1904, partial [Scytalidium lignicola]
MPQLKKAMGCVPLFYLQKRTATASGARFPETLPGQAAETPGLDPLRSVKSMADPTGNDSGSSQLPASLQGSRTTPGPSFESNRDISTQSPSNLESFHQQDDFQVFHDIDRNAPDPQAAQSVAPESQKFYEDEGLIPVDTPSPVMFGRPPSARPSTVDEDERQIRSNFQNLLKPNVFIPSEDEDAEDLPPIGPLTSRQFEEVEMQLIPQMRYYMPRNTTASPTDRSASTGESVKHGGGESSTSVPRNQEVFFDGLIPVEAAVIPSIHDVSSVSPVDEYEVGLQSNLQSLLEMQSCAAPAPRWVSPPHVVRLLQEFEEIERRVEEGLEVADIEHASRHPHPLRSPMAHDEDDIGLQRNLESLLTQPDFAPPERWNAPVSSLQVEMDFQGRIPLAHGFSGFYDGLIAVEDQTPGPVDSRPALSTTEDGSQMRLHFSDLLRPTRFPQSLDNLDLSSDDQESLDAVKCTIGTMWREGDDRKLTFKEQNFSSRKASLFSQWLNIESRKSIGLIFLIITDWRREFGTPFHNALPDFPMQTLMYFDTPEVASVLPTIDYNEGELYWLMEHINIKPEVRHNDDEEREIDLGHTNKAQCLPLVVWTRAQGALRDQPDRPLIVVISRCARTIREDITQHYLQEQYKRWDRLRVNQAWVYLDLYFLFTRWDQIWDSVKYNLNRRTEEIHGRRSAMPIQHQTRQLHSDNRVVIGLREHVRIHKTSIKIVMQRVENMLGGSQWVDTQHLKTRLEDAYLAIEFFDVTATTLLEQQQNLLSLAFNLETIANGQAVARLNALAFIFLPLSFVASLFGITTWSIGPSWYPVVAVPVLVATIVAAYGANKLFNEDQPRMEEDYSLLEIDSEKYIAGTNKQMTLVTKLLSLFPLQSKQNRNWNRARAENNGTAKRPGLRVKRRDQGQLRELQRNLLVDPSRPIRNPAPLYDLDFSPAAFGNGLVLPRSTVQFVPNAYGDTSTTDMARLIPRYDYDGNVTQRVPSSRGNASISQGGRPSSHAVEPPRDRSPNMNAREPGFDSDHNTSIDNTRHRATIANEHTQGYSFDYTYENQTQSHQPSDTTDHAHLHTHLQMEYDVSYAFGGSSNAIEHGRNSNRRNVIVPAIPPTPPPSLNGSTSTVSLVPGVLTGSTAATGSIEMSTTPPLLQQQKKLQHSRVHTPESRPSASRAGLDTISEEAGRENQTVIVL